MLDQLAQAAFNKNAVPTARGVGVERSESQNLQVFSAFYEACNGFVSLARPDRGKTYLTALDRSNENHAIASAARAAGFIGIFPSLLRKNASNISNVQMGVL